MFVFTVTKNILGHNKFEAYIKQINFMFNEFCAETIEKEMDRLLLATQAVDATSRSGSGLHFKGVWQAVKAICALLGNVETLQITDALDYLSSACLQFSPTVVSKNTKQCSCLYNYNT
jgi:phosphatidylinositol-4-phosphate 3-kinase